MGGQLPPLPSPVPRSMPVNTILLNEKKLNTNLVGYMPFVITCKRNKNIVGKFEFINLALFINEMACDFSAPATLSVTVNDKCYF